MKCEHGHEITVEIVTRDGYWSEGIYQFDATGRSLETYYGTSETLPDTTYLEVTGCPECKLIRLDVP